MQESTKEKGQVSLSLRSSQSTGRSQHGQPETMTTTSQTGQSGVSLDTGVPYHSQQVINPASHPSLLHTSGSGSVKEGLEMTVQNEHAHPHMNRNLPGSQFAPSGAAEQIPDDVLIQKQQAKESYYSQRSNACSMSTTSETSQGCVSPSSCASQNVGFESHPVSESVQGPNYGGYYPSTASHTASTGYQSTSSSFSASGMSSNSRTSRVEPTSMAHQPLDDDMPVFVIRPEEYPPEFKEGQFDCVLIYSDNDSKLAVNFKDILTKFVVLEDGRAPSVCILDRNDNLRHIQSRFAHADEAMDRSTYMFLFITFDFVKDAWAEVQKDECLMESIRQPEKKWCVVPLHTDRKKDLQFRYPYGLRALKGVDISVMMPGKKLDTVCVADLKRSDIDGYFIENITRMFNQRLKHRLDREREHNLELQKWINREKEDRMQNYLKEKHEEYIEKLRMEEKRRKLQLAMEKDAEEARQKFAAMEIPALNTADKHMHHAQPQRTQPPVPNMMDALKQFQAQGGSLDDVIKMLSAQQGPPGLPQQTTSAPGQPPVHITYNIDNRGVMQVGNEGTQHVGPEQTPAGEPMAEDIEFDVEERPEIMTDGGSDQAPPGAPSAR